MSRYRALLAQAFTLCAFASLAAADCVGDKDVCIRQCNAGEALDYQCINECFEREDECSRQGPPANTEYGRTSELGRCVELFYDPDTDHLLTFHNICSEKIHINFLCRTCGEQRDSVMVLRPGQKKSAGETGQDVDRKGGYSIAVCRSGYMAVGMDGGDWGPDRRYQCQRIGKGAGREDGYFPQDSLAVLRHH